MNLFQTAIRNLENVGISRNQSRLNGKLLMAFILYWLGSILDCVFIVRELNSFEEIVSTIFLLSATTSIAMCFTVLIASTTKIFELINESEQLADKGKLLKFQNIKSQNLFFFLK